MVYLKRLSFEQTEQLNLVVEPSPWSFSSRSNLDPVVSVDVVTSSETQGQDYRARGR